MLAEPIAYSIDIIKMIEAAASIGTIWGSSRTTTTAANISTPH